jgi:hypothetical protein
MASSLQLAGPGCFMSAMRLGAAVVMLVAWGAAPAGAQAPAHDWSDGTSVNLFGGVAADADGGGGLAGGGAGWTVTPTFGLEGRAGWSNDVGGAEAFAASLVARFSPWKPRPLVPFLKAGVGLYRAVFDSTTGEMPEFYRRRLTAADGSVSHSVTWTDPTLVAGAGFDIFASRHVAIRPEVDLSVALDGGHGYAIVNAMVNIVYHFEDKRVTP